MLSRMIEKKKKKGTAGRTSKTHIFCLTKSQQNMGRGPAEGCKVERTLLMVV